MEVALSALLALAPPVASAPRVVFSRSLVAAKVLLSACSKRVRRGLNTNQLWGDNNRPGGF